MTQNFQKKKKNEGTTHDSLPAEDCARPPSTSELKYVSPQLGVRVVRNVPTQHHVHIQCALGTPRPGWS